MSKHKRDRNGVVYSTNPEYVFREPTRSEPSTLPPSSQKLTIWLDRKHRGGKEVTLIRGFVGSDEDLTSLGKNLKSKCGTGGSVKDGEILIQGNHREKILKYLTEAGYTASKLAGG